MELWQIGKIMKQGKASRGHYLANLGGKTSKWLHSRHVPIRMPDFFCNLQLARLGPRWFLLPSMDGGKMLGCNWCVDERMVAIHFTIFHVGRVGRMESGTNFRELCSSPWQALLGQRPKWSSDALKQSAVCHWVSGIFFSGAMPCHTWLCIDIAPMESWFCNILEGSGRENTGWAAESTGKTCDFRAAAPWRSWVPHNLGALHGSPVRYFMLSLAMMIWKQWCYLYLSPDLKIKHTRENTTPTSHRSHIRHVWTWPN